MKTAATRQGKDNVAVEALNLAFELGETTWKLGFTTGAGQRPRLRTVTARDVDAVGSSRFGMTTTSRPASSARTWWTCLSSSHPSGPWAG